jgi:glycosyltransferase involved in cell wall biosynthesis/2-polyprenyl-3-methyl-5-hydroxy-6-metoxy-1,4-benzoquinol methylase
MPRNVIFVSHCDFHGNSAIHLFSIANALTDLGCSCAVCVPQRPETVFDQGQPRFQVFDYEEAVTNGVAFANGRVPDLVHAWTPREPVRKTAMSLVQRYSVPYFVHFEDNEIVILLNELPGWSLQDLEDLQTSALDAMVPAHTHPYRLPALLAGAAGVTALIDRLLEFKPGNIPGMVFFPGYDADFAKVDGCDAEMRAALGILPEELLIVYSGSVHKLNSQDIRELLLAVALVNRRGFRVKLVRTGRNALPDFSDPQITRYVSDRGFVPRAEVPRLVAAADVLVEPGRPNEFNDYRFPSKVPEFLASGKPVILPRSNVGLLLKDGEEALVLEHGHSAEIADALQRLAADPELRARIGRAGRAFALRNLDWTKNIAPLASFYERCLAQTRAARPSPVDEATQPKRNFNLRLAASVVRRLLPRRFVRRPGAKSNTPSPVDPELLVNSFYKVAFGRFAEPEGLAHHIRRLQSGVSSEDLAEDFVRSAELKARHGSNQRVDARYLVALYRDGLGRRPDPKGLKGWLAAAEKGATRAEVLAGFALSTEALEKTSARFAKRYKTQDWFTDARLADIAAKCRGHFVTTPLSYGTVRDFCDSFDHLRPIATANGDLKDNQRPWVLKAILSIVSPGSRVLEIGAGEPFIADILDRLGYEVWVVDPYDGTGNGPVEYERFRTECPNVRFVRNYFAESMLSAPPGWFDCIYSISVLEHVPANALEGVFAGIKKYLRPTGWSIHAVDHVHKGLGAAEYYENLKSMVCSSGFEETELTQLLERMDADPETYYLSAESLNRWRGSLPYDEFPMRVCVSVQIISEARHLRVPTSAKPKSEVIL